MGSWNWEQPLRMHRSVHWHVIALIHILFFVLYSFHQDLVLETGHHCEPSVEAVGNQFLSSTMRWQLWRNVLWPAQVTQSLHCVYFIGQLHLKAMADASATGYTFA
jgi:hypothetical protein